MNPINKLKEIVKNQKTVSVSRLKKLVIDIEQDQFKYREKIKRQSLTNKKLNERLHLVENKAKKFDGLLLENEMLKNRITRQRTELRRASSKEDQEIKL
ncbi:hypothetical protein F7731_23810 [Cytobacillus depressus]|uniref:Uncharacterized protein n=1 Tax=Cytobacillus depressus TaxID=1602942 RepID=A0A6L3V4M3_9BACI|nr:hypothetical protein [Cytobacillus depressus]KAB2328979.1 hypothetical protein F7731_23810 [Cytobacillus depressus]